MKPQAKEVQSKAAAEPNAKAGEAKKSNGLVRGLIYAPILLLAGLLAAVAVNPQLSENFTFLLGESRSTAKPKNVAVHETNIPTGMLREAEEGSEPVLIREKEASEGDVEPKPEPNAAAESKP